ncbi:Glucokinase [Arcanobacterium haemolyticum]|uniref:ROK family transcriptional regulator n=1 Tax=Arcanobacterium haemolyticum TaxID=28264 RepID=UPI000D922670|nr:ROK family transcriptional regulator [Arcanobacterium haemolyticum]SPT75452.1 Glucokinase [Arcanobacterium haemolyticum]
MDAERKTSTVSERLIHPAYQLIKTGAAIQRSDLVRELSISPSTASNLVRTLVERGLVREAELRRATGGRPARKLEPVDEADVVAVAEIGTRHIRYWIVNSLESIDEAREISFERLDSPRDTMETMLGLWNDLRDELFPGAKIVAYGISVSAPVDSTTQRIIMPARMVGWHDVDLRAIVHELTGCPAWIENDARAAALGEIRSQEGTGTFIYIKAGSGIGGALVINGEVFAGGGGMAGDVGHARVTTGSDVTCACGRVGCLEAEASGGAILRQAREVGLELASMSDLVQATIVQTPDIMTIIRRSGELVGNALSPLVNFVNPDEVLVGGSLSSMNTFMSSLRAALFSRASSTATAKLVIEPARLGQNSPLMGAARGAYRVLSHERGTSTSE